MYPSGPCGRVLSSPDPVYPLSASVCCGNRARGRPCGHVQVASLNGPDEGTNCTSGACSYSFLPHDISAIAFVVTNRYSELPDDPPSGPQCLFSTTSTVSPRATIPGFREVLWYDTMLHLRIVAIFHEVN